MIYPLLLARVVLLYYYKLYCFKLYFQATTSKTRIIQDLSQTLEALLPVTKTTKKKIYFWNYFFCIIYFRFVLKNIQGWSWVFDLYSSQIIHTAKKLADAYD